MVKSLRSILHTVLSRSLVRVPEYAHKELRCLKAHTLRMLRALQLFRKLKIYTRHTYIVRTSTKRNKCRERCATYADVNTYDTYESLLRYNAKVERVIKGQGLTSRRLREVFQIRSGSPFTGWDSSVQLSRRFFLQNIFPAKISFFVREIRYGLSRVSSFQH